MRMETRHRWHGPAPSDGPDFDARRCLEWRMAARKPTVGSQLVVIGSSAGGIEALSRVVAGLPPDFPAPIVIAQHLDPRRPSHLGEILSRHATLPIKVVEDAASLENGVIFVVPSNRLVAIVGRRAAAPAGQGGQRRAVGRSPA